LLPSGPSAIGWEVRMPGDHSRRRYAIVGTGARAGLYADAAAVGYPDVAELVGLADPNPVRVAAHNERLVRLGARPVPAYAAEDFGDMLAKERVDVAVITTVDRYHDEYIVAALQAGCDVITEKPMTVDAPRCRRILDAAARATGSVTVTFNYRYNPVHEKVRELLAGGAIGEVASVHFEWLLDVRHGADYFRRWHRDKARSGGLLVHKASHHFDLVNWWLGARPAEVYATGKLFFYGPEAGARHGFARDYERAHDSAAAAGDPFALHLAEHPALRALYLDAEAADGYHRDQNVFAPGVSIEDDMGVVVRYSTGATMTYHLTAYSPWEGYRIGFNGSHGRLEVEVVENDHVAPKSTGLSGKSGALHGVDAAAESGWVRILVRPFWAPPREIPLGDHKREGHGGADARMLDTLLRPNPDPDPLGRRATEREGAQALLVGLAANRSIATGSAVRVADLLEDPTP
jgi:predicted dehydrogenase